MSGQHPYAAGQPPYMYSRSDPSGEMFVQPLPSVQNGPSCESPKQQFPPLGGPVGYQASGGAHTAGFLPPTFPTGSHHQNPSAITPPTAQFTGMVLSDHSRADIQTRVPPGIPPSSGQINGPSQVRGAGPPPSVGIDASSNMSYHASSVVATPSSLPRVVSSQVGGPLLPTIGGHPTQSSVTGTAQSPSNIATIQPSFGRPQPSTIGRPLQASSSGGPQPSIHGGFPPPSNVKIQQSYSTLASVRQKQDEFHEHVPPQTFQPQQHQQFHPPPFASMHGVPSHQGHPVHPPPPGSVHGVPPQQGHPAHPPPPGSVHGVPLHQGHSGHPPPPGSVHGVPLHQGHSGHPPPPGSVHGVPPQQGHPAHPPPPGSVHGVPLHQGHSAHPPPPGSVHGVPLHQGHSGHPPPPGSVHGVPPSHQGHPVHPPPPGSAPSHQGHPAHPPPPGSVHGVPPHQGHPVHPPPPGSVHGVPSHQGHPVHPPPPGSVYGIPPYQGQPSHTPSMYAAQHQGQSVHPPHEAGPLPLPSGQGQIFDPHETGGQFPGTASYDQQSIRYPGQQPPQAHPPQQPSPVQQKRLDPDQMPSPIQVIEDDRKNRSGVYQTNVRGNVPPLVTTNFITQDQGNSSPRFIRSTMYNIPCSADLLKSSHIPFALVLTPFAQLEDQEQPPPLVDLGELGPVRCKRCKAYMCPFMQFIDGGRRFQCPFCNAVTDVPNEYFAHLDHTGRRVDCFNRPELCLGSYEFVATKDYCRNGVPAKEPAFIFMIDVSYNSVKSGLLQLICDHLKSEILVNLPREAGDEESEIRVGFVTYHKELHFYNVKNCLAQPQMMVVSDLEDMFVPVIDGFLVKLSESEALIDSLLAQLPNLFAESQETGLVLGPVIQAGLDALKSADRAGRLYLFHTGLPTVDAPGKLKNRDDQKLLGTDKEKTLLTPQTNFYSKLGAECVAAGCSVDLFLFPNQYIDMATISDICKVTAGNIYKYSYFQADIDGDRFLEDLKASIKRSQAFDITLRVRTSTGIRPVDFYGNFYMANTTDVEMAAADTDSSLCVEVKHDDKLSETEGAYIQVAVLYTSVTGQRRLRCHNLSVNCCSQMTDLFRNCELDTLINCFSKQALRMCLSTNPKHVREHFTNEVAQILACYRKECTNQSSPGQLVLPECMKLLPVYANCVIKNDSTSGGSDISSDDRSYLMHLVNRMDVKTSHVFFYPRLLPVHNLDLESAKFPVAIRCTVERLEDSGMYILENGLSMFLWIGQNVSTDLIQKVFGVSSAAQIDIDKAELLKLDNPVSRRLCDLIAKIRKERSRYLKLIVVRQRDKLQPWFEHFLVEDKGQNSGSSYVDFLLHIHKEIRNILN